ncbi:Ada metal-binding domain-containing protein [Chryseobacterium vrystaatense]|uniref:Metal binding domain of Ada n=1 Tax=Chryseobacterium vrystaatense TaxID=307480 RepID=A0A1M5PRN9_9FLAO|nr:Ada metal-binding domain-containing protein [Chryseobacterium vrystaatense]KFF24302.1 metal-binding protein [Chryseobacterium vrystaatense]SHH04422.1 Metal binding domain of Ada [Chryseobacterium vrystaatense]
MEKHTEISDPVLRSKIRKGEIQLGGNRKLKIYGLLTCVSGKRMKKENRVFFRSEKEALEKQYRPCGHCMKEEYRKWKKSA